METTLLLRVIRFNSIPQVHIPIPNLNATTSSVKYNPRDQSLYVWDNGVASQYEVTFHAVSSTIKATTSAPSNSISSTISAFIPTPTPPSTPSNQYPSKCLCLISTYQHNYYNFNKICKNSSNLWGLDVGALQGIISVKVW